MQFEQTISREEEAILWRSLERIPEIYREPLVLFYREHQSAASVAQALDLVQLNVVLGKPHGLASSCEEEPTQQKCSRRLSRCGTFHVRGAGDTPYPTDGAHQASGVMCIILRITAPLIIDCQKWKSNHPLR